MTPISISHNREVFWDDYLIDTKKTTAFHSLMHPEKKDYCFIFDQGYEPNAVTYPCIVKDERGYKMYYLASYISPTEHGGPPRSYEAVIESTDGIHWTRPNLNIFDHPELTENNVVVNHINDGLCVFYDTNPNCPPEERYKAIGQMLRPENGTYVRELWSHTSPDGYHFAEPRFVTDKGSFDSLNTVFWKDGRYICYIRHLRPDHTGEGIIRDVSVMYSEDFQNWTDPMPLKYKDDVDYQLYTNNIFPYDWGHNRLIGLPMRYCERSEWNENCDLFASTVIKKRASEENAPRVGIAVTDCLFMTSYDGETWTRYQEAFLTPGIETPHNWVYGDAELAYRLIDSGQGTYHLYGIDFTLTYGQPRQLMRYEIRHDGFACMAADHIQREVITKPLTFTGSTLHLNFETSAFGSIYVDVLNEDGQPISPTSFEVYGNSLDRPIRFQDGTDFAPFANQPVRLRFKMLEAKLYSMWLT